MTCKLSLSASHRRLSVAVPLLLLVAFAAGSPAGGGLQGASELAPGVGGWPAPNRGLDSTRAAGDSAIDSATVGTLRIAWRFRFTAKPGYAGVYASTPLAYGGRVYVQDLGSNVYALDRASGALLWTHRYRAPNGGPNGLAAADGLLFGGTDTRMFALDAASGRQVWARRLISPTEQFIDIAPIVADGLVFTSTIGYPPGGRGALYALDARTGQIVWRFDTIRDPWRYPKLAGGGGAWFTPSVDAEGRLYVGIANPAPWGGTPTFPNGGMYPGPVPYTDSLLALGAASGELLWFDQVTPHDVRDYDFQVSPILATLDVAGETEDVVIGAGKAGIVVAWDRDTGRRLWTARVGKHRNDLGPLPRDPVPVCPGLYGGVETPMALVDGRLFVPVVDLCVKGSAVGYDDPAEVDASRGTGELVALDAAAGARLWSRRFPSALFGCATVANDVVFVPSFDGRIYGLSTVDGRTLWTARARAGINACPAVDGDTLLVGAGSPHPAFARPAYELIAFRLPARLSG